MAAGDDQNQELLGFSFLSLSLIPAPFWNHGSQQFWPHILTLSWPKRKGRPPQWFRNLGGLKGAVGSWSQPWTGHSDERDGVLPLALPGPVLTLVLWEGGQRCESLQMADIFTLHDAGRGFRGRGLAMTQVVAEWWTRCPQSLRWAIPSHLSQGTCEWLTWPWPGSKRELWL